MAGSGANGAYDIALYPSDLSSVLADLSIASKLPKWRIGRSNVLNGIGNTKIFTCSDSIGYGVGGIHNATQPNLDGWPRALAKMLAKLGIPSTEGFIIPQYGVPDARLTSFPTGWSYTSKGPCGRANWFATSPSSPMTVTPGVLADTYDVYYISTPTTATASHFSATGGTPFTGSLASVAGSSVKKDTITAAAASVDNIISLTGTGAVYIMGIEPYLSTASQVLVGNMGLPGQSAYSWDVGGDVYDNGIAMMAAYGPAVTAISLGVNDAAAGHTVPTFNGHMDTLSAGAVAAGGDLLYITPPPQGDPTINALINQYIEQVYYPLATKYNAPIIDWHSRFGGVQNASFMGVIHPNNVGYADFATWLAGILAAV